MVILHWFRLKPSKRSIFYHVLRGRRYNNHALAELCLTTNDHPTKYMGQTLEGHIVDEDMVEHIAAYCAYVKSYSGVHLYDIDSH